MLNVTYLWTPQNLSWKPSLKLHPDCFCSNRLWLEIKTKNHKDRHCPNTSGPDCNNRHIRCIRVNDCGIAHNFLAQACWTHFPSNTFYHRLHWGLAARLWKILTQRAVPKCALVLINTASGKRTRSTVVPSCCKVIAKRLLEISISFFKAYMKATQVQFSHSEHACYNNDTAWLSFYGCYLPLLLQRS